MHVVDQGGSIGNVKPTNYSNCIIPDFVGICVETNKAIRAKALLVLIGLSDRGAYGC